MIYDCFTYNGEADLLEIRFNILSPLVDKFVIVEGWETFSGNPKPLYWIEAGDRFEQWKDKVVYHVVNEYSDEEIISQIIERDYVDANAFKRAFYQKESIRKVLESLNPDDEDIIYYGDVDEVWKPKHADMDDKVYKLRQLAYSYYLNNRSPEDWRGTIVTKWKNLKGQCLNDMRANPKYILEDGGWHFTNMGGHDSIIRKIESYDHQEVNVPQVREGLKERLEFNEDFLGRGYKFWVEEKDLPEYLLNNQETYQHLWK